MSIENSEPGESLASAVLGHPPLASEVVAAQAVQDCSRLLAEAVPWHGPGAASAGMEGPSGAPRLEAELFRTGRMLPGIQRVALFGGEVPIHVYVSEEWAAVYRGRVLAEACEAGGLPRLLHRAVKLYNNSDGDEGGDSDVTDDPL